MIDAGRLAHVYWLGGSPCSGKSTIADRLAARHGFTIYRCDDAFYRHAKLVTPESQPVFHRIAHAAPDDIWLRPVSQQISEEIALYGEEFPFILDDILSLPGNQPVIAEGAALMPQLLASLPVPRHRKIWLVPEASFQRHHYDRRLWRHDVLRECSDPDQAWENWMERDAGFARAVAQQAARLDERLLLVDGSRGLDEVAALVSAHLRL